jgi:hypothetical protein
VVPFSVYPAAPIKNYDNMQKPHDTHGLRRYIPSARRRTDTKTMSGQGLSPSLGRKSPSKDQISGLTLKTVQIDFHSKLIQNKWVLNDHLSGKQ